MPFRSQAQWRWAFANKKPWASEWAKHTPRKLSDLPERTAKAATTGNFSATAGQRIGGQQCRDENGHFVNCDDVSGGYKPMTAQQAGSSMAAYEQATEEAKLVENEKKKLARAEIRRKLGIGASARGGGKISPAERKRQAREEQKKNETATHGKVGPGGALGAALSNFADPDNPGMLPNLTAARLQELGLVELSSRTGKPYITGEGRAYINAARSGDVFAAREAMQRAQDAALEKQDQAVLQQQRELERAQREAFQQQIDMIQGTPEERALQQAYDRRARRERAAAGKPKKPARESNRTYGSGKVVTGSPKSTVKELTDMQYEIPSDMQTAMTIGMDIAKRHAFEHPSMRYLEKAIKNESLTYKEVKDIRNWYDSLKEVDGDEEKPTAEWIVYQLVGGQYGYDWADSVMSAYEMAMSTYKATENKIDRIPSQTASTNAIRGLDIQHAFKRGGSESMIALGRKIANRQELSDDDIRAMHSYLQRHTGDRKDGWADISDPSVAYINWMIHGADEGLAWASEKVDMLRLKREKPGLQQYKGRRDAMMGKRPGQSSAATGDYALPAEKRFPITDYGSVTAALNEWTQYRGLSKYEDFKKGLIAVALRKGLSSALPKAWRKEIEAAQTQKSHSGGKDSFSPPAGVQSAAKRGLELRSKFGRGGTSVGIARARDLSNGSGISASTIRRMNSFFARHAVDKRPDWSNPSKPSNGYIAHLLWGGDAGRAWASKISRHLDAKTKEYPPYVFNSHIDIYRHRNDEALKKEQQRHKMEYSIKSRRQRAASTFESRQKATLKGKNKPNNPSLWSRAVAEAKKKYRVYPSAYANGYAAQWYKKHGGTWKTEKDLRDWFAEDWVDISRPKKGGGYEPCGRKTDGMSESEYRKKYPKCVPASRAARMSESDKRSAIERKRDDGLPKGSKPSMVSTSRNKSETVKATFEHDSPKSDHTPVEDWVDMTRHKPNGDFYPCNRPMAGLSIAEFRKQYPMCRPLKEAREYIRNLGFQQSRSGSGMADDAASAAAAAATGHHNHGNSFGNSGGMPSDGNNSGGVGGGVGGGAGGDSPGGGGGDGQGGTKSTTMPSNDDLLNALFVRRRNRGRQSPSKGAGVLSTIVNM